MNLKLQTWRQIFPISQTGLFWFLIINLNHEIGISVLWGFEYQAQYMSVFESAILELKMLNICVALFAIWLLILKNRFKTLPIFECVFGM